MIGAVGAQVGCTLGWLAMLAFNRSGGYDMSDFTSAGEIYALMGDAFYATIDPVSIIRIVSGSDALTWRKNSMPFIPGII